VRGLLPSTSSVPKPPFPPRIALSRVCNDPSFPRIEQEPSAIVTRSRVFEVGGSSRNWSLSRFRTLCCLTAFRSHRTLPYSPDCCSCAVGSAVSVLFFLALDFNPFRSSLWSPQSSNLLLASVSNLTPVLSNRFARASPFLHRSRPPHTHVSHQSSGPPRYLVDQRVFSTCFITVSPSPTVLRSRDFFRHLPG